MDAHSKSHFALFGLPERFALDPDALEAAYRRVQAAVHPDRFATAGDTERRIAMQWAAQANEAHSVLRDPSRRAAYLAERRGAAIQAESNTAMPADFLALQMPWHEALDDARDAGDPAAVAALRAQVAAERDATLERIARALDVEGDAPAAAQGVRKLMFVERLLADL